MKKIDHHFEVPSQLDGYRLDKAIATLLPEYSRNQLKQWILEHKIQIDNQPSKPRDKISSGQHISIHASLEEQSPWQGQPLALDIVFEDKHLIVINKPTNLVVHPGAGNPNNTLVNGLIDHYPALTLLPRCGIVHRIDKNTTGLLVVVKTQLAHQCITQQLQTHHMKREYEAIAKGILISGSTIEEPIGRHPQSRIKMAVHPNGKPAITHYRIIERFRQHTHVSISLETGRTHQIRVHFNHILHPLLGDPSYGTHKKLPNKIHPNYKAEVNQFTRQALHAKKLSLTHPETGKSLSWETPLPKDMQQLLQALKSDKDLTDD